MYVTTLNQQAPSISLDYRSCSVVDLRSFITRRTSLTKAAIRKLNKAKMVSRLKKLDAERTFSRFMELPTELRLDIYQRVLLINGEESGKNHPALLRVSRLINSESEPVLYCDNTFCLQANISAIKVTVSESWESVWDLLPARTSGWPNYIPPLPIKMKMLFSLRNMTLRLLDFEGRDGEEYVHYGPIRRNPGYTYRALTTICLMLSSASRLKTLTITDLPPESTTWSVHQLTTLLFPIGLINKTTAIRVEGGTPALHAALEASRRTPQPRPDHVLSTYGSLLSRAIDMLARARREAGPDLSYLLRVALDDVLLGDGCLSGKDLRRVIARLEKLETIVGNVGAELDAL